MTHEFNKWWNKDDLTNDNLYRKDTPMYWAWEGWRAGQAAARKSALDTVEELYNSELDRHPMFSEGYNYALDQLEEFIKGKNGG